MTKFPRVPVEIDLGEGPVQTAFRLTNYAVASIKEQLGPEGFAAFQDPAKLNDFTETEKLVMDATVFWALLLHAHEGITIKQVLDNLPVIPVEYAAIAGKMVEAFSRGQPPVRPIEGPMEKPAPKKTRANGGIANAKPEPSSSASSEFQQTLITN